MNPYRLIYNLQLSSDTRIDLVESQITGQRCISKKVLKTADSLKIHQFHVEVDVLSQFNHPFVPVLIDVIDEYDSYALIESYIDGPTLTIWKNRHPLRFQWYKRSFLLQLFDLLDELHGLGYLYIDVKPDNLIVRKNKIYLIDFNACVEIGSLKTIMASKQNFAPEFNRDTEKKESSDVWALGKLIKTMYLPGIVLAVLLPSRRIRASNRFQSIRSMRKAYLFAIRLKRVLLVLLFFVGLCFFQPLFHPDTGSALQVYLKDKDPMMFQNAYTYTVDEASGSYLQKNQMALYQWLSSDWLTDSDYEKIPVARYLLEKAIVSGNTSYCDYLLGRIPDSIKEKMPDETAFALALCKEDYAIPYSRISDFIDRMAEDDLSFYGLCDRYMILITLLHNEGIVLDKEQRDILYQIRDAWTITDFSKADQIVRDLAYLDSEYILFLKSKNIQDVHIHPAFIELMNGDEQFSQLLEIERNSK